MTAGGKRPGAGRPKGGRNKVTADIKVIAQSYGEEAITALVEILRDGEAPPAARVAASKEILDRGYGKAHQSVDHSSTDGTMTPLPTRIELVVPNVDGTH
ncbi:hypothetical protein NRB16_24545 [Pseudomonas sp. LJDD11]|uniref:hypothetical protein n=1 Tax=unclassified Pseudomonas TaxID=196821 RepID=UPI002097F4AA|nr:MULTISPECIES: hypothetical protein [unclassified Pseudomonas]MCO8160963.1 hypothetical protein [Pseudomonas sp. 21LCFQ010]MCQ9426694.1 hypothetical protein [Pseudomonas sp. LJDD11]